MLSAGAFGFAFAWMAHVGTNRSLVDLNAGIAGFVLLGVGLLATVWLLISFPWRTAVMAQFLLLALHGGLLVLAVLAAHGWLGAHIA
jgi:hypothetical protein